MVNTLWVKYLTGKQIHILLVYINVRLKSRPLRTREEEYQFIYGDLVEEDNNNTDNFDYPSSSAKTVTRYVEDVTNSEAVSEAAVRRIKQLEKQFPLHDVEPGKCHQLSPGEVDRMSSYVDNVKKNVAGQGVITQLGVDQERSQEQRPPSPPAPAVIMPPPMKLLPIVTGNKYEPRQSRTQSSSTPWSCAGCGESMCPGEVAIFAERAGGDKCWHPQCFSCSECGEVLEVNK